MYISFTLVFKFFRDLYYPKAQPITLASNAIRIYAHD
jgi:hypothetical protein